MSHIEKSGWKFLAINALSKFRSSFMNVAENVYLWLHLFDFFQQKLASCMHFFSCKIENA